MHATSKTQINNTNMYYRYYSIYCIYHIYIHMCECPRIPVFSIFFSFLQGIMFMFHFRFGTFVNKYTNKWDKKCTAYVSGTLWWPLTEMLGGLTCTPKSHWMFTPSEIYSLNHLLWAYSTSDVYYSTYTNIFTQTYTSCQPREQQKTCQPQLFFQNGGFFFSKRPPSPWSSMSLVMSNFGFFKIFTSNKTQPPRGDDPRKVWLPQPLEPSLKKNGGWFLSQVRCEVKCASNTLISFFVEANMNRNSCLRTLNIPVMNGSLPKKHLLAEIRRSPGDN